MAVAVPPTLTWLVRHGQSASNAGLPATGAGNTPLTELGQRQARELAARVERQPDLLIVSDFVRSRATAAGAKTTFKSPEPAMCPGCRMIGNAGTPDRE